MEYRLLTDDDAGDLAERVNAAIAEGWRPLGGASMAVAAGANENMVDEWRYAQALTREKTE